MQQKNGVLGPVGLLLLAGCLSLAHPAAAKGSGKEGEKRAGAGFYQAAPVTGIIRDEKGAPIQGVSVNVKGTNRTVVTDAAGRFTIDAGPNDALIFTSVGYTAKEVNINGQTTIDYTLQQSVVSGDEIVVIGYQTVRRRDLTGATAVVNTQNTGRIVAASVGEQLQGQVPGVTVRNSGAPGGSPQIEIRGVASFSDANPLYVIDGMIADANNTVNPDDIASIQVLKDASAAAIYGSRAANGVIIVTTKKGRSGPNRISFSARYGVQQIPKKWDVMDAAQYLQTVKTQYANSGVGLPSGIAAQLANSTVNTDWQDAVYRTGQTQDYTIGISGGSATGTYLISGGYYKSRGVLIGNDFERASLRINTETHKGILTVGENILISNSNGNNPGGGINAFYESATSSPVIAVQNTSYINVISNPQGFGFGSNAVPQYSYNYVGNAALDRQHFNYSKIIGNGYADLKFTKWLSYRFNAGLEASFDYATAQRDSGIYRYNQDLPSTRISNNRATFTNILLEHTLNFNKTFGDHAINGVVGYSYQQQKHEYSNASRLNLVTVNGRTYSTVSSASGLPSSGGGIDLFYRLQGYLGRVNYTYKDRYLLTTSGRIDQDSRFGANYRTGKFYSVAASWRLSKEDFFHSSLINDLKIRGSYGKLGISSPIQSLAGSWPASTYINSNQRAVYGINQTPVLGQSVAVLGNPNLHWEERNEANIGFDAALLNNQITVSADVYNNISKDVLTGVPVPYFVGGDNGGYNTFATINAASIRNRGVELAVTYHNNKHDFKWDVSVNGTTIQNRVIGVGAQGNGINYIQSADFIRSTIDHPMAAWYVIKTAGIFQSQDEINNYKNKNGTVIQPGAKPGDVKYVDYNGDGQINNDDRQFEGSPWPKFQGGLQLNGSYKNFSINIQFVSVLGYQIYNDVRHVLDGYSNLNNFRSDLNPWSTTNTSGTDPRLAIGVAANNYNTSDRWLQNGSYFRLRNLELAYALPKSSFQNLVFTNTRFFVSGQSLFTITKYSGLDPDITGAGVQQRGVDYGNWPSSRIISIGISSEF